MDAIEFDDIERVSQANFYVVDPTERPLTPVENKIDKVAQAIGRHDPVSFRQNKTRTIEVNPIEAIEPSDLVETFVHELKEYQELEKVTFSFEQIEELFAEYIKYLGEYKRTLVKSAAISKEVFRKSVDRLEASYKNKLELSVHVLSAALTAAGGIAGLASAKSPAAKPFVDILGSAGNVANIGREYASTQIGGKRSLEQILLERLRQATDTMEGEKAQPGKKQDETSQRHETAEQIRHRAAGDINH